MIKDYVKFSKFKREEDWGGGMGERDFFLLSNKIGPFRNPLKSMINSAYSYSGKSKYEQLF